MGPMSKEAVYIEKRVVAFFITKRAMKNRWRRDVKVSWVTKQD